MAKLSANILNNLLSTSRSEMEDAFNVVYNEFSYLVYYVSFQIVKEKTTAEDITNETFLRFYNNKENVTLSHQNVKYYLVETSKNLSINFIKVNKRYEEYNEEISNGEKEKLLIDEVNDFNEYIERFREYLNEEEIDLLVYHLLYDFGFREIAEMKGTTVNVVSSKYKRTIDKLKKLYQKGGKL